MPRTPRAVLSGASAGSRRVSLAAGSTNRLCQPPCPRTKSPRRQAVRAAGLDHADALALHDLTQLDRGGIGRAVVHPAAHIGVERQPDGADQHLARPGRGHRRLVETKVLGHRHALRAADEENAGRAFGRYGHGSLLARA